VSSPSASSAASSRRMARVTIDEVALPGRTNLDVQLSVFVGISCCLAEILNPKFYHGDLCPSLRDDKWGGAPASYKQARRNFLQAISTL